MDDLFHRASEIASSIVGQESPALASRFKFKWTVENMNVLRRIWAAGGSANDVANEIGTTRNAVCGKLFRLGLLRAGGPTAIKKIREPKAPREPKFKARQLPNMRPLREAEVAPSLNLTLDALSAGQCRYPCGDGPFTFCGHKTHAETFYCEAHSNLCGGYRRDRQVNNSTHTPHFTAPVISCESTSHEPANMVGVAA